MTDLAEWLRATDRSLTRSGRARSIALRRTFADATPDEVWAACTEPERLGRWLGVVAGDLIEGGTVTVDLGGRDDTATCEVVRCDQPRRLTLTWQWPGEVDTALDLRLRSAGDAVELLLEHVAADSARLAAGYGEGWESGLWKLDRLLRGEPTTEPPWPEIEAVLDPHWQPLLEADAATNRWPHVEGGTITARCAYAAPPAEVWAALTDPDRLSRWFGTAKGDLREHGEWTVTFDNGSARGTVRECVPGERFVTSWHWDHEPAERPAAEVSVTLTPQGDGTVLELRHTGADEASAKGQGAGWYAHLEGLGHDLDGRAADDWYADFTVALQVMKATSDR
ncbi:SRPBCC domain-containing protein [Tenggerimyces flavus]|uniref:SRPBCC domain-containing protein n=1 Tax=Tenggerimyces flavus TaxID=1708749 RepID=A0ABV7YFL8_9ACTN|nr:SRPBCC domain-containing protein [Tenggerimyces flavus]MBM7784544.1 uncharacterized protein YndB with AHSA1/START domain [Tenggerimyces flavus]